MGGEVERGEEKAAVTRVGDSPRRRGSRPAAVKVTETHSGPSEGGLTGR